MELIWQAISATPMHQLFAWCVVFVWALATGGCGDVAPKVDRVAEMNEQRVGSCHLCSYRSDCVHCYWYDVDGEPVCIETPLDDREHLCPNMVRQ